MTRKRSLTENQFWLFLKLPFAVAFLMGFEAAAQTPGTFTATGSMTTPRTGHSATLLKDGRVLIAGGNFDGPPSAELFDPATGTFAPTSNMIRDGIPVLLPDGRVLFLSNTGVELFDPSTGIFTDTAAG